MKIPVSKPLVAFLAGTSATLWPIPCQASPSALPWDYTFAVLQALLLSYIAPAAIGLALCGSIVLYTLGDRDEQAGRLFGSALGGLIALGIVYFLNYVGV